MESHIKYKEIENYKDNFVLSNREILMQILSENKDTEYGKKYDFSAISSADVYQEKVPVSTYEDYSRYVDRIRKGEKNLITSYDIYGIIKTSGSTQVSKFFPMTNESLRRYSDAMDRFMQSILEKRSEKRLMLAFFHTDVNKDRSALDVSIVTTAYYRYLYENDLIDMSKIAGGKELTFFEKECDYMYAKLWIAFATTEIVSIESIFLYDVLLFFKYMEDNYASILEDMESGHISDQAELSDEVKDVLLSIKIDRDRIAKIRRECDAGFDDIAKKLWPKLKVIGGIGSTAFKVDELSLKKYICDIPVWHYIFGASECFMGICAELDSYDYILFNDSAYYEFKSIGEHSDTICDAGGLSLGGEYELIVTTYSGLYRYAMGDVIKITGFYGTIPMFKFLYRKKLVLNIAGEKFDGAKLDRAIRRWDDRMNLSVWQYYFYEDYDNIPGCYHGVMGLDRDDIDDMDTEEGEEILDELLRSISDDYDELRRHNTIRRVSLEYVNRDVFLEVSSENKDSKAQSKSHHILRNGGKNE